MRSMPFDAETMGSYRLVHELGRGGMGVVYLAEDTQLSRTVALKFLFPTLANDRAFIDRFQQEARAISGLNHPHIVHINSFQRFDDQQVAIDMEYVGGGSLGQLMAGRKADAPAGAVSMDAIVTIAYETLLGLQACHHLGVVHRDIKPSNILLTGEGRVKITDFGLATAYASHLEASVARTTSSSFFMGTPRFAPPEAWECLKPEPMWDFYSLGVVLYEALTGVIPYDGGSPLAIIKQMTGEKPPTVREVNPSISEPLGALVDSMMSRSPEERPQSAEEAIEALRATPEFPKGDDGEGPTIVLPLKVRGDRTAKTWSRSSRALVASLALVAVVFVGSLFAWFQWSPSRNPSGPAESPSASQTPSPAKAEAALASSRFAEGQCRVYSVTSIGGEALPGCSLLYVRGNDGGGQFVAYWESGMLRADAASEAGNVLELRGGWARFRDRFGRAVQRGTLTGTGQWLAERNAFTATLRMVNDSDNTVFDATLSGVTRDPRESDTQFFATLEEQPSVMSLIYNELLPRGIDWAIQCEGYLPALPGARYAVPAIDAGAVRVDGILSEETWFKAYYDETGRIGELKSLPGSEPVSLHVRSTPQNAFLGVSIPVKGSSALRLAIAVQDRVGLPFNLTPRYVIRVSDDAPIEFTRYVGSREAPWETPWHVETGQSENAWTVELAIPRIDTGDDAARMRLNAALFRVAPGGEATPIATWGWPELDATRHGALLVFKTVNGAR